MIQEDQGITLRYLFFANNNNTKKYAFMMLFSEGVNQLLSLRACIVHIQYIVNIYMIISRFILFVVVDNVCDKGHGNSKASAPHPPHPPYIFWAKT